MASDKTTPDAAPTGQCYLEGLNSQSQGWRVALEVFPFCVGRLADNHLCLAWSGVSRRHAEFYWRDGMLWLHECGSTNGTFHNNSRLSEDVPVRDGDIIHFGALAFRLSVEGSNDEPDDEAEKTQSFNLQLSSLPESFARFLPSLDALLKQRAVVPHFQPVVRLQDGAVIGHELLGRCQFDGLPHNVASLLRIATALGKGAELSELFRDVGVERAVSEDERRLLFVNTSPQEMQIEQLSISLRNLRERVPKLPLVLEIHETVVTDLGMMVELHALLQELGIDLAYDDFGAGQARLIELIQVPPEWLKFDISLIRTIHQQPPRSRQVLESLVRMVRELGIKTLAEGVERVEEAEVIRRLGFEYAQGYLFGRPTRSLSELPE